MTREDVATLSPGDAVTWSAQRGDDYFYTYGTVTHITDDGVRVLLDNPEHPVFLHIGFRDSTKTLVRFNRDTPKAREAFEWACKNGLVCKIIKDPKRK